MMTTLENKIEKSFPVVKITGNEKQKTIYFNIGNIEVLPGQFFMLNYNMSQKPFSVSHYNRGTVGFTIEGRGKTSSDMLNAELGDYFGLTGPLGNTFDLVKNRSFLLIGGGVGTAPLYFLANYLINKNKRVTVYFGARSKEHLQFAKTLQKKCNVEFYTDDGSMGKEGFFTEDLKKLLKNKTYDTLCLCGPEVMMKIVIGIAKSKIKNIQVCMERYMKCGLGICGSCVLDDVGLRVCEDGPVFNYSKELADSKEFGNYKRNGSGLIEEL